MKSDEGLLPCPFCGETPKLEHSYREDDVHPPRDFWHVRIHCDCDMASTGWRSYGNQEQRVANCHIREAAEAEAIAAWNTRTPSPSGAREILARAIETLASSRHLIGKYVPDHHWLPEHDARIAEIRAALATISEGT